MRLLVTDAAAQPPRQATAWLIMTLGRIMKWRDSSPAPKRSPDSKALAAAREKIASEMEGKTQLRVDYAALDQSYISPESTCIFFVKAGWYRDEPFGCADCGKIEVWTATQQKWWYEVAKGKVHQKANRCRECRKIRKQKQEEHTAKTKAGYERKKN